MKMATMLRRIYSSNLLSLPKSIAKAIDRAVNARRPRVRYRAGFGAGMFIALHAILPARCWDRLGRKVAVMYGNPQKKQQKS